MTYKESVGKTGTRDITGRRLFLRSLYGSAPDNLYLELRYIHPETGEVRTLWERMGDKRGLTTALKQADQFNREGFGLYFAPCLRKEKKGNADSAVWVSALWLDIDSTDPCDLDRLKAFDPEPSFIVSSGGGWHGYWVLEPPCTLETDAGYVKSVASVMRLPDSVNTKPERGGVVVEIVQANADCRYSLDDFGWLESKTSEERIGDLRVVTLNSGSHQQLPPRTEQYITSGAHNGSRNAELFAAACQMRDAGYSQSDAERELVARHVADGNRSENPATREKKPVRLLLVPTASHQEKPLPRRVSKHASEWIRWSAVTAVMRLSQNVRQLSRCARLSLPAPRSIPSNGRRSVSV
ncbi:MAG: hypothetical protein RLP44_10660 [Aggregatilineales bacterium]